MEGVWILLAVAATAVVLFLTITRICFYIAFYAPRKKKSTAEEFELPPGEIYTPYHEVMIDWMKKTRGMVHQEMSITSFDGLKLYGKYYEYAPGAPVELMFHGYRGTAERDLCGGVQRCFELKRNVLIVDQRTSGKSEGRVISFGINESRDCLSWIDHLIARFGEDVQIILTGISMGAATVMTAAGRPLPKNVIGILADCGYTSARDIIKKVIRQMKLPANLLYPFVKWGARIYGRFDLEEISPVEAMAHCPVPIIFVHGETDDFVPCDMSRRNYEVCTAPKRLYTVPGAGHGLSYIVDKERYLQTITEFSAELGLPMAAE